MSNDIYICIMFSKILSGNNKFMKKSIFFPEFQLFLQNYSWLETSATIYHPIHTYIVRIIIDTIRQSQDSIVFCANKSINLFILYNFAFKCIPDEEFIIVFYKPVDHMQELEHWIEHHR